MTRRVRLQGSSIVHDSQSSSAPELDEPPVGGERRRSTESRGELGQRRRAADVLARSARWMTLLFELTDRLQRAGSIQEVYDAALDAIHGALVCERAAILLFDAAGVMHFVASRGVSQEYRRAVEGHSPWRADEARPRAFGIPDIDASDLDAELVATVRREGIRALAFIPLVDVQLIGKFMVYYDAVHAFADDELEMATAIGSQIAFGLQRLQAEQALSEGERRLRLVCDSIPALIGYVDREQRYRFLNARYGEWFGVDTERLAGIHMRKLLGEEAYAARLPYVERVLRGEAVRFERYSPHQRFGHVATELTYVPHVTADGRVAGFYVMGFDITERKRIEQVLRVRARQQRAVAALGSFALRETDPQKVFEYATRLLTETLEVEFSKILEVLPGSNELSLRAGVGWKPGLVGTLRIAAGVDSQAGYALLSHAPVVVNNLKSETRFSDTRMLTDHGVVSGISCLITGAKGQPWGVVSAHALRAIEFTPDDVSFLASVANTLSDAILRQRAEEALRENDRRKDEFLATLSHELRNPLAPLKNALHMLRLSGDGANTAPVQDIMERQVNHLVRLVDDLLVMSRISRGTFELRRERVELAAVVKNAVETSQPLIDAAGHRLTIDLPREPVWLDGDPVRLAQVISNLLNNAAKYTGANGRIEIEARLEPPGVAIAVRDNGAGISAEALPSIFEMFSRGDQPPEPGGNSLGIGLALARRLAEMHRGTIEAHSEGCGRGSEFILRLPLARVQQPVDATAGLDAETLPPTRVLVVDDNHDGADTLGMLLDALGVEVRVAHDGAEALKIFAEFAPAAVLLDIGMPDMDGYEVARRIREAEGGAQTLLVALTGWGQSEDRRRAREAGFDHHLTKPADLVALQSLLASTRVGGNSRGS